MFNADLIGASLILAPVLALLTAGLLIALASGGLDLWTRQGRRVVLGNLALLLLRLAGLGAGLIVLQRFVGQPIDFSW
jgi:hypothetical protein